MRRAAPVLLASLPGVLVAAAAGIGWVPAARDLPTYFVPLRHYGGMVLRGRQGPFWNPQVGCGEPFYANPQTALLYPPGWLPLALPADVAVGVEVGVHLAVLGVGGWLLARRLGAATWLAGGAGLACACTGPVASAAGVLNNLETLAWLPWMWQAATAGSVAGVAIGGALAWLGGEPVLAVLGAAVALVLAPSRRTLAGVGLAGAVVAVQAIPFALWVAGGDRGPGSAAVASDLTPLGPGSLWRLALPGPAAETGAFVENLSLPLWAALLGVWALADRGTVRRRLVAVGWVLAAAAVLPGLPAGETVWRWVTGGLVRHPARLLFPAAVAVVVGAAACPRRASLPLAAALGALGTLAGLAAGAAPLVALAGGAGVFAVLGVPVAAAAGAVAGAVALVPAAVATLHLRLAGPVLAVPCLEEQRAARRVFVVEPSQAQAAWVAARWPERAHALGWGYTPLVDGRRMVRTFAPLQARSLAVHLREADRGPGGRWWLDSLGADVLVSPGGLAGFPRRCVAGGVWLQENPEAWPDAFVATALPEPGSRPLPAGRVLSAREGRDEGVWEVDVEDGGVFVRLTTPDPGWRFTVDGRKARRLHGPGIVHAVPVAAGRHLVRAVYRPPGLVVGLGISALGLGVLAGAAWRRW